jgi:hypothetical protein
MTLKVATKILRRIIYQELIYCREFFSAKFFLTITTDVLPSQHYKIKEQECLLIPIEIPGTETFHML